MINTLIRNSQNNKQWILLLCKQKQLFTYRHTCTLRYLCTELIIDRELVGEWDISISKVYVTNSNLISQTALALHT